MLVRVAAATHPDGSLVSHAGTNIAPWKNCSRKQRRTSIDNGLSHGDVGMFVDVRVCIVYIGTAANSGSLAHFILIELRA